MLGRQAALGVLAVSVAAVVVLLATSTSETTLKSFSSLYDQASAVLHSDAPFVVEMLNVSFPSSASPRRADELIVQDAIGDVDDVAAVATPVPEVIVGHSAAEELSRAAAANAAALHLDTCDWSELRRVPQLNPATGMWSYNERGSSFCNGTLHRLHGLAFPIDREQLLRRFSGKRIVFMGDSVARNSFVLTMARMCNPDNFDKCITRCPTMEYDIVSPPANRGPMGCVPNAEHADAKSQCYEEGQFANIPLRGLTLRSVPQDRNGRRNFIRKGLIGPVMGMTFRNVTLLYHPITKPNQLTRTSLWMARHPNSLLHGDVVIVSIGPHLKLPEVQATPSTLIQGLTALRAAVKVPILAAEFVHALASAPGYKQYVDDLMVTLRNRMAPIGVVMVPQRFITQHGFMLSSGKMSKAEANGTVQKGCGYYDAQHPALRCQMVTSDMLLGAAIGIMAAATPPGS